MFTDLIKFIQPLVKILSLLFLIIFLPLLPIMVLLVKGLAMLVKLFTGGFGGVAAFIGKVVLGILLLVLASITGPIWVAVLLVVGAVSLLGGALKDAIVWIASWIKDTAVWLGSAFMELVQVLSNAANWIWSAIQSGFNFILGIGEAIWQFFLTGLSFISDLGQKIWDFIWEGIKGVGKLLTDGFKLIINGIISFINSASFGLVDIPKLANGGIVTKPTTALIGEAGPEAVIPLNKLGGMGTTININNPTVRNDSDIRKMTDAISRELQKRGNRGFSSI